MRRPFNTMPMPVTSVNDPKTARIKSGTLKSASGVAAAGLDRGDEAGARGAPDGSSGSGESSDAADVEGPGSGASSPPGGKESAFPEAVRLILSGSDSDGDDVAPSPTPVNPTTAISTDNSPPDVDGPTITSLESRPSDLRRAILDLTDELRSQRQRRGELTSLRMIAGVAQLLVLLLALLGLLQLGQLEVFITWMLGAALLQMLVITLVLFDLRS